MIEIALGLSLLGLFLFLGLREIASAIQKAVPHEINFVNSGTSRQIVLGYEQWAKEQAAKEPK